MNRPLHQAYNAIEDTMQAAVRAAVDTRAQKLLDAVRKALASDDFKEAHDLVNRFTLGPAVEASKTKWRQLGISALLFGASRHKPVAETGPVKGKKVPAIVDLAVTQLGNMLKHNCELRIRAAALLLIGTWEDQHTKFVALHKQDRDPATGEFVSSGASDQVTSEKFAWGSGDLIVTKSVQSIAKADDDLTADEIGAALAAAVMGNAKMVSDIGGNLITSRLASYGFLAEARADGVTTYRISAVLDDRTCPVCESLDGTEFEVDKAFARVEAALGMDDPDDLKVAAPWPDKDEDLAISPEELQAAGYDAPPFHPGCRCILVPVEDKPAEKESTPTTAPKDEFTDEAAPEIAPVLSTADFMTLSYAEKISAIAEGIAPEGWQALLAGAAG